MCLIRAKRVRKLRSKGNLGTLGTRRAHTMGLEIRHKVAISFSSSFADMCAAAAMRGREARTQKGILKNTFFLPRLPSRSLGLQSQSMMNFNSTNHFKFHLISHIVGLRPELPVPGRTKKWQIRISIYINYHSAMWFLTRHDSKFNERDSRLSNINKIYSRLS